MSMAPHDETQNAIAPLTDVEAQPLNPLSRCGAFEKFLNWNSKVSVMLLLSKRFQLDRSEDTKPHLEAQDKWTEATVIFQTELIEMIQEMPDILNLNWNELYNKYDKCCDMFLFLDTTHDELSRRPIKRLRRWISDPDPDADPVINSDWEEGDEEGELDGEELNVIDVDEGP